MRQRRFIDAAMTFNRAVELNDRLITAFAGLGVAQHACGREQESLATFDLAASLEPSTTLLFAEAARLQMETQGLRRVIEERCDEEDDYDPTAEPHDLVLTEVLRRHQQAAGRAPQNADLRYRCGLLLRQLGRFDEAIEEFRAAAEIDPSFGRALVKLAICLKECGQTDEAIRTFQRALQVNARQIEIHYQLGLLFAQRNQFDLAVEEFEQAAAENVGRASFRANLALALQHIGMVDKAAATWRSICELSPDTESILADREAILRDASQR
jgi:tetratricopeptide (TPR) repeat protein